jgi:hypothetical protein
VGDHFENRIRELQTSVEWTGVATGLRPTQTRKVPANAGRPRNGEGDLARRPLRTSDVVRGRGPDDRERESDLFAASETRNGRGDSGESEAGDHDASLSDEVRSLARARREIDTKKASEPLTLTHRKMQCIAHAVSTRFYDDW